MRSIACERCGAEFECGAAAGACWCKSLPAAKIVSGDFADCLCAKCITELTAVAEPKPEEDYYYNESGLMVFTRAYHLKRGYCCKSGCKHCPFDGQTAP